MTDVAHGSAVDYPSCDERCTSRSLTPAWMMTICQILASSAPSRCWCPPYAAAPFDFHGALLDCVGETISRESFETRWREAEARNAGDRLRILRGLRATPSYRRGVKPRQLWAAVGWLALLVLVVLWTVVF